MQKSLETLNTRSRLPLTLVESSRPSDGPVRLSRTMMRQIRKSLLFIADGTPIARIEGKETPQLIPSPNVCVEIGYAVQSKQAEQILIAQMQRPDIAGQFPFDLPTLQCLPFKDSVELNKILPQMIETQLQRFKLFS